MAGFDRVFLSPKLVEERSVELPFGLTPRDLGPALRGSDGTPRDRVLEVVARYDIQGLHQRDNSRVITLRADADQSFEVDVFVKLATDREAEITRRLISAGVPIPPLLFDVATSEGAHVLGFEFLPTIGIDFDSPGEVTELLAAVAVLNACSPETLRPTAHLPPGRPEAEFTARVASALAFVESIGILEWATPNELIAIYAEAKRWAVTMPTAVTHGEMYFQQVGRRRAGQLVMFDLATVGVRPRFSDLCSLVTGIDHECSWDEGDVLAHYLAELERAGATTPLLDEGLTELRRLRVLSCFESLPWLVRSLDDPHLGDHAVVANLETLRRDLHDLRVGRQA